MKARIIGYRRSRHTTHESQALIAVEGITKKKDALKLVGKKCFWLSPAKKKIAGKIIAAHGSKGALRARFSRGLPGQAIGNDCVVLA